MTTPKNDDEALCLTVAEVGKELYENRIRLSNGHPAASNEMAIRALKSAYELALNHYQTIDNIDAVPDKWASRPPMPGGVIQSKNMQRCEGTLETDPNGGTFSGWLTHGKTEFEHQIFDRTELQRWLEANGEVSSYRFDGVGADVGHFAASQPQATIPSPAPVLQAKAKRHSWWDVASPHMIKIMRAGQYATAKELYNALEAKAGLDSPFDKGTGNNRFNLFVRELATSLSLKTVQNNWQKLLNAAAQK